MPIEARLRSLVRALAAAFIAALAFASAALAESPAAPPLDAAALVRQAVQHHLDAEATHHPLRYLLRRIDPRRDTTKEIVETKDGGVARLVAIDGEPLTPEADRAELDRLNNLLQHPELQEHRRKSEQRDSARVDRLMRLLPEAFLYKIEGTIACGDGQCYRLSFIPNPHWSPPDMESGIFRGISGEAWIEQAQERLIRIDARFTSDVDFGFGLLGKLRKGSTALIEQSDAGGRDWEITTLKLDITGKALLVKSLSFQVTERASRFSQVAKGLSYQDAIRLLEGRPPTENP